MELPTGYSSLDDFISQGRFIDASAYLLSHARELEALDPLRWKAVSAEIALAFGRTAEAAAYAHECLHAPRPVAGISVRAYRVLAAVKFETGDLADSIANLQHARALCKDPDMSERRAQVELARFAIMCAFQPLETAAASVTGVRRVILRTGKPHLIAEFRLAVARTEARRHALAEAQRHQNAARELLDRFPNAWLDGLLELDRSIVSFLLGDLERSIEYAQQAVKRAEESGHFRTRLAAAINMSHLMEYTGNFAAAKHHIDFAVKCAGENRHLMRAALDSLANLLISTHQFAECHAVMDEAARRARGDGDSRPHWDAITELYSRARLADAEGRWTDAARELREALGLADRFGDETWRSRVHLALARCQAFAGDVAGATQLVADWHAPTPMFPENLSHYYSAIGATLLARSDKGRAQFYADKSMRIALAMGNAALHRDLRGAFERHLPATSGPSQLSSEHFDTAVALIELGAHPHILAREAFTVIRDAGCAEAVAVVAAGKDGARVIETHGWTEQDALAAVGTEGTIVMPAGMHRDEPWRIVARPGPDLDAHCTLAAIGRLVAAAVALEAYRREEKQRAALWPAEALDGDTDGIWASEQSNELLTIARRIAPTPLSVLLTGETGTGKEMLARVIHRASDRAERPFLPFNCAAVPRDLLESQLFGYRKGAFTGADGPFQGVIRSAAGGTLFLDEIAEVGLDLQPKLLRFLETHEIHPIGEPHPVTVDVRVIAATNGNVEDLVAAGRFREDLFYRLNVIRLKVPPLRERREEIPALVQHYLRRHADEQKKGSLTLSDEALEYLLLYSWPGNVRQLANEVRRMVALAEPNGALTPALLSTEIQASRRTIAAAEPAETEVRVRLDQPLPVAVEMLEQIMVRRALARSRGRVEEASRLLGISRKGLFLKRRRWGLPTAS